MRIEHIAMYVNDLEKTKDFLFNTFMQNPMTDITIKLRISVPTF